MGIDHFLVASLVAKYTEFPSRIIGRNESLSGVLSWGIFSIEFSIRLGRN